MYVTPCIPDDNIVSKTENEQDLNKNRTDPVQNVHKTCTKPVQKSQKPLLKINELTLQNKTKKKNKEDSLLQTEGGCEQIEHTSPRPESAPEMWVARLHQEQIWKEAMAMKSGRGQAFLSCFPDLAEEFIRFLRLIGEENTVNTLEDAKRRFYYWMISAWGRQSVAQICTLPVPAPLSPHEEWVEGRRMHDGIYIPDHAPPRPDSASVWNPHSGKWEK